MTPTAWPSPLKKLHDATKAWAEKHFTHLGQFQPKSLRAVHLRWTVTRGSHSDKTGLRLNPRNPNIISPLPRLCPNRKRSERRVVAGAPVDLRSGAVARLLIGAVVERVTWRRPKPGARAGQTLGLAPASGRAQAPFPDSDVVGSGDGGPR
jgi:hypothetical protein